MVKKLAANFVCAGLILTTLGPQSYAVFAAGSGRFEGLTDRASDTIFRVETLDPDELLSHLTNLGQLKLMGSEDYALLDTDVLYDEIFNKVTAGEVSVSDLNGALAALEIIAGKKQNSQAILSYLQNHLDNVSASTSIAGQLERQAILIQLKKVAERLRSRSNVMAKDEFVALKAEVSKLAESMTAADAAGAAPKLGKAFDMSYLNGTSNSPMTPVVVVPNGIEVVRSHWLAESLESLRKRSSLQGRRGIPVEEAQQHFEDIGRSINVQAEKLIRLLDADGSLQFTPDGEEINSFVREVVWMKLKRPPQGKKPLWLGKKNTVGLGTFINKSRIFTYAAVTLFCELHNLPADKFLRGLKLMSKVPRKQQNNPLAWMMKQNAGLVKELQESVARNLTWRMQQNSRSVEELQESVVRNLNGEMPLDAISMDPAETIRRDKIILAVDKVVKKLSTREKNVVKWHFGFYHKGEMTLEKIADKENHSRQLVHQVERGALNRLIKLSVREIITDSSLIEYMRGFRVPIEQKLRELSASCDQLELEFTKVTEEVSQLKIRAKISQIKQQIYWYLKLLNAIR